MSAFVRTRTGGTWSGDLTPDDLDDLESKARKALSKRGGAYNGGLTLSSGGTGIVVRDLTIAKGATAQLASTKSVVLAGSSLPAFSEPVTHRVLQSFAPFTSPKPEYWNLNFHPTFGAGLQSIALAAKLPDGSSDDAMSFATQLRTHHGATLKQLTFRLSVPTVRKEAVYTMPRFRVVRVTVDGVIEPLKAAGVDALGYTADADGFVQPIADGKAAAWGESQQSVVYVCDKNNVIDLTTYSYQIEVIEERYDTRKQLDNGLFVYRAADARAAVDPEGYAVVGTLDDVPGAPVDGVTLVAGDVVLVVGAQGLANPAGNEGLYTIVASDPWFRSPSMDQISQFSDRTLVYVKEGTRNGGTLYQCGFTSPPHVVNLVGGPELVTQMFVRTPGDAFGNIYHSALLEYEVSSYGPQ